MVGLWGVILFEVEVKLRELWVGDFFPRHITQRTQTLVQKNTKRKHTKTGEVRMKSAWFSDAEWEFFLGVEKRDYKKHACFKFAPC